MARCKGDSHLNAIADRRRLNAKITGILARRGGPQVLETLARNETAAFSTEGRHCLEMRLKHRRRAERRHLNQQFEHAVPAGAGAVQIARSHSAGTGRNGDRHAHPQTNRQ